jgi:hypothetical protein
MNAKIMTIASVVFALVFVILMAIVFRQVATYTKASASDINDLNIADAEAELVTYNNTIVSGDTVMSTINKLKELKSGVKMSYLVYTNSSTAKMMDPPSYDFYLGVITASYWQTYGYAALRNGNAVGGAVDTSTLRISYRQTAGTKYKKYEEGTFVISPVEEYYSYIIRSDNETPLGILFIPRVKKISTADYTADNLTAG